MRRRELRLRGFDYSQAGLYFVTTCASERACVFGEIVEGRVRLSRTGIVAEACLVATADHHPGVRIDSFVVMPNHVHAVVSTAATPLGLVVATFKAAVTRGIGRRGLWQRGYYDHVIRDEDDLARVREYIATNPIRWAFDPENPGR